MLEPLDGRSAQAKELRARLGTLIDHVAEIILDPAERAVYAPLPRTTEDVLCTLDTRAPLFAASRSFLARLSPGQLGRAGLRVRSSRRSASRPTGRVQRQPAPQLARSLRFARRVSTMKAFAIASISGTTHLCSGLKA